MALEIQGKLIEKFDEQQVTASFKKREFVLETSENNFTEQIKFELTQDRVDLIDPYQIGDSVKVSFNLRGRKWNDKYFVNVQAWKIENLSSQTTGANNGIPADVPFGEIPPENDEMGNAPF